MGQTERLQASAGIVRLWYRITFSPDVSLLAFGVVLFLCLSGIFVDKIALRIHLFYLDYLNDLVARQSRCTGRRVSACETFQRVSPKR